MTTPHFLMSPSKANIWMNCRGSLLGPSPLEGTSTWAQEGSVCHSLLEACIRYGFDPQEFLGQVMLVHDEPEPEHPVNQEMINAVQLFLGTIDEVIRELFPDEPPTILSEMTLVHPLIPEQLFGGTTDCMIFGGDILVVIDLKYGREPVYATSPQLTCYSLLAMAHRASVHPTHPINRVVQIVVQPRSRAGEDFVSRHEPGTEELLAAWEKIQSISQYLLQFPMRDIAQPELSDLQAGGWCRRCPRQAGCLAHDEMIQLAFSEAQTELSGRTLSDRMTIDELVLWSDRAATIKGWLKTIEIALLSMASQGHEIPGRKLVSKLSNRQYTEPEEKMMRVLPRITGIPLKELKRTSVLSPNQVEKLLKEKGTLKTVTPKLSKFLTRRVTGVKLVDRDARGEAIASDELQKYLEKLTAQANNDGDDDESDASE